MTGSQVLWYYLWLAPKLLQAAMLLVMVRRGLHRQFPMFFVYTAAQISQSAILFAISRSRVHFDGVYFSSYAVGLAVSTALRFCVIHEMFIQVAKRHRTLEVSARLMFRGAALLLLLIAVGLAISAPRSATGLLWTATFTLDQTASILQCGLLIGLFVFSRYFALSWRSQAFGIALGMGIFSSMELANAAARLFPVLGNTALDFLTMGIYHCCALVWLFYMLAPERSPKFAVMKLPSHDLEIWNQELQRLLQQ